MFGSLLLARLLVGGGLIFSGANLPAAPLPDKTQGRRESRVVVMTYNLRNFLSNERHFEGKKSPDSLKTPPEIEALVAIICSVRPDVLFIQEIGDETQLQLFRSRLESGGLEYAHFKHHRGADDVRCLALLSKFTILSDQSISLLPYLIGGVEEKMRRGILDVTLLLPDASALRVVGVHLKSRLPAPQGEAVIRRNEAILLRRHVDKIFESHPDVRLLVLGDFNDTHDQPSVREIFGVRGSEGFLWDIRATDSRGDKWTFYSESSDRYERVDYILASRALRSAIIYNACSIVHHPLWFTASDHRPVVVVLKTEEPVHTEESE